MYIQSVMQFNNTKEQKKKTGETQSGKRSKVEKGKVPKFPGLNTQHT